MQECVVTPVGGGDLVQAGLGEPHRGDLAGGDPAAEGGRVETDELVH